MRISRKDDLEKMKNIGKFKTLLPVRGMNLLTTMAYMLTTKKTKVAMRSKYP